MDIMHLYEQSGDTINVYNFNTNGKKVIDFKKKELEKIPKEERVITFTKEVDSSYIFHEAVKRLGTYAFTEKDERLLMNALEIFDQQPVTNSKLYSQELSSFLDGNFHDSILFTMPTSSNKKEQYFISTSTLKGINGLMTRSSINGYIFDCETFPVIQLTEKLYSLQLLVRNNSNAILKDTITDEMLELMSLFEFTNEPIKQFNIKTLNELCQFGLLPEEENDKVKKKVWQSTELLQKVRETYKKEL